MGYVLGWLQRHFWVPMLGAVIVGLLLPGWGEPFEPVLQPAIVTILTLVFARLQLGEALRHVREPRLMAYLLVLLRLVVPLAAYLVLRPFSTRLAIGVALLTAMPPAAASPVFTELVRGNLPLCLSVYILSYLVAPATVTLVMGMTAGVSVDLWALFRLMAVIIFLPIILAEVAKRWVPRWIARTQHHFGGVNLVVVTMLIFVIVSGQAAYFREHLKEVVGVMALLYGLFAALHGVGYWAVGWRPREDRLAVSVTTAYMNTALAVVVAADLFPPEVVLVAVASEIPWSTTLGPFHWLMKRTAKG